MEFEFDKEIDFLLRQTAQDKTAFGKKIPDSRFQIPDLKHLDNDEISAFAENALPEKTRRNYTTHLANCERCRKNLAGLIVLNGDTEDENIHVEQFLTAETIAPKISWYKKFFVVQNLAYAMGGLILVFAGIGVFTILQNNSRNAGVSQAYEKQTGGKGMSSDGDAAMQEVYSSNQLSSNTAAMNSMSSSNSAANSAISAAPSAANSNAITARRESNLPLEEEAPADAKTLNKPGRANEKTGSLAEVPPPPVSASNNLTLDGQDDKTSSDLSQGSAAQNQTPQNQTQITPDTRNVQRAPMPSAKPRKQESEDAESKKSVKDKSAETTVVGGKNFTRANNVWIDSAYRGQTTANVSRGTKEYKKLDSGLRGIVENLGGTVIVVWKEKAYRIQ